MWSRKRIEIGWTDLLVGAVGTFVSRSEAIQLSRIEQAWGAPLEACLTLRSAFDLMLHAYALPRGSEVLVSAVTIPGMLHILEHHGLVPVPVGLNRRDLSPNLVEAQALVTPRTRAVLIAHLFGNRIDVKPWSALARDHDLLLWEDCAQAYVGGKYRGHDESDARLFSFGPTKTSTALGGGILPLSL